MGYYINEDSKENDLPSNGKAKKLIEDGATITEAKFQENLICVVENGPCVVENGPFDAAAYCYDENEFKDFNCPSDNRKKTWLIHKDAKTLSGYI